MTIEEIKCLANKIRAIYSKQSNSLKPPTVLINSRSQPSLMTSLMPDRPTTFQLLNDMVRQSNFNSNRHVMLKINEEEGGGGSPKHRSKSGDIFNRLYQEKFRKKRELIENEALR
jgi:hypothetical protein